MAANNSLRTVSFYKKLAKEEIPPNAWTYFSAGCEQGITLHESEAAFRRLSFRPHLMRTNFERDLSVEVFGHHVRAPIGVAPTAFHRLVHADAEKGTAKGVEKFGTVMIVSNWANTMIEDIAASAPGAHLWMQTFIFKNRQNNVKLVKRAERSGFEAIVVTLDVPIANVWKHKYSSKLSEEFGNAVMVTNMDDDSEEIHYAKASGDPFLIDYMVSQTGSCAKWEDIVWLKSLTKLPVLVKGVLTAETAREAASIGVDGIIVSAHGGRQLDEVPAPIEALPEVVDAVRGKGIDVYMDGGVRSGSDVAKAIGLGAKMVFMGRPFLWALAVEGSDGVCNLLEVLENELDYTMALCGCNKLSEMDRSRLRYKSQTPCKL